MNRIFTLILLCFLSVSSIMADEVKLIKESKNETPNTGYNRMPSKVWLTCDAENGILTFSPSDYYVTLFVTVECKETGENWEGVITEGNMSMEYSTLPGTYSITCVNELECSFMGYFNQ